MHSGMLRDIFLYFRFIMPLPDLTPEGDRMTVIGFRNPDPTNFNCAHYIMLLLMTLQVRLFDVFIMDYSKFTL